MILGIAPGEFSLPSCLKTLTIFDIKEVAVPVNVVDHPLIRHKLALMRENDVTTKDFRDLASELATLLTYEATKDLETETKTINGWAGPVKVEKIKGKKICYIMDTSYFKGLEGRSVEKKETLPVIKPNINFVSKKTQQVHMCLGTKGLSIKDKRRYAFAVLDNVLGGSMSSRLFQEIRERRGLAYSIYSSNDPYRDFGVFSVCAGIDMKHLKEVTDFTLDQFKSLKKEGISKEELDRAKSFLKGSLVLGLESTASRMSWLSRSEFYYGRTLTIDEIFSSVDKVTQDDIIELSKECFQDKYLNLTAIGNFKDEKPIKELKC